MCIRDSYTTPVVYLAMERVKARLSRPAPLQTELDLAEHPQLSPPPLAGESHVAAE